MDLEKHLRQQIWAYVQGTASLETLHDWLASHERALPPGSEAEGLADELWLLFADYHAAVLSEDVMRTRLSSLLTRVRFTQAPPERVP